MLRGYIFVTFVVLILANFVHGSVHKDGYCAMYGNCGKKSIFGSQLPCPNNIEAVEPDKESSDLLENICGSEFKFDKLCCSKDQLLNLQSNLKKVDPLISSCPACKKNFYDFFCEFTCSPNQSTFVNITDTVIASDTKKAIVSELTQYVNPSFAATFFDSCKNLKFSATNGYAMDLIGGGAKTFQQFLKFLGDEKPLLGGSPFQMNFQFDIEDTDVEKGITLRDGDMKDCSDKNYKCACSDCLESCPTLPSFIDFNATCTVGKLPCFSFAVYMILLGLILAIGGFHVYLSKHKKNQSDHQLGDNSEDDIDVTLSPSNFLGTTKDSSITYLKTLKTNFITSIDNFFEQLGYFCSKFPGFVIGTTLFISVLLSICTIWIDFETDPVNLWVSPEEPHLKNYQYFEENFGEWFRVEQIIISNKDNSPILNWDTIKWWFERELEIQAFTTNSDKLSLDDFCFKPLGDACVIESFTQYFGGDINYLNENNWKKSIKDCTDSPVNCLPAFQQPLNKNLLFDKEDVLGSEAFVVTILLNSNLKDEEYTKRAVNYEDHLQTWVKHLQKSRPDLNIAFSTEISLKQELNQSTNTDVKIVVISYLLMFLYASVALGGKIPIKATMKSLIHTRFLLGFSGILIILLSVLASLGLFSMIGLKSTLIIAEVIPFLVLAIGIDNIFLIVHELHLVNAEMEDFPLENRISLSLKNIGPSCFTSAVLQITMFLLATSVDMPAVKNFAFYSAGAICINFLLQMTTFISLLTLDQRRLESGRIDCFPWYIPSVELSDEDHDGLDHVEYDFSKIIRKFYAPKVLSKTARPKILTVFILWFGISLSLLPYINLGLDQKIALPKDSYLINYFESIEKYLNVGPPIFFVIKDLDVTKRDGQQKVCGKFSTCNEYSMANVLEQEFKRGDISTVNDPTSNWLDDFLTWLNPNLDQCCRMKKNSNTFCSPSTPGRQCESCYTNHDPPYNISMQGLPENDEFMFYFEKWIQEPSDPCPLGGKAPYSNSISFTEDSINTFYLRTSHSPLRSQNDFITAFKNSLRIVKEIKSYHDNEFEIFAFSPFYIFFVQYDSIISLTITLVVLALIIIYAVSSIFLGSLRSSLALVITIFLILINIGGILSIWNVSLNAVSLVNLIICMGLSVEFCIHITKGYGKSPSSLNDNEDINDNNDIYDQFMALSPLKSPRVIKSYNALVNIGGSVLGGITITKFIGIAVLAFTRSKIFEVYYFRMWLSLIFIAAIHSLCLLPVLLSYIG